MRRTARVAASLVLVVGACGGDDDDVVVLADGMAVVDAWARPTPTGARDAAVYVTVENRNAPADRLIGASSARCMVMAPHLTVIDDDIASMSQADAEADLLALLPGGRVEMNPNDLHFMCLGLTTPLVLGDRFDIVLQFHAHDPVTVSVEVADR